MIAAILLICWKAVRGWQAFSLAKYRSRLGVFRFIQRSTSVGKMVKRVDLSQAGIQASDSWLSYHGSTVSAYYEEPSHGVVTWVRVGS